MPYRRALPYRRMPWSGVSLYLYVLMYIMIISLSITGFNDFFSREELLEIRLEFPLLLLFLLLLLLLRLLLLLALFP